MEKQEIFKLQLDAFIQPFIMWRVSVGPTGQWPKELIQSESLWKWNEDVEHDSTVGFYLSTPKIYNDLVQEIVDVFLMQISKKGTEEYDNIPDRYYAELCDYVNDKLEDELLKEGFWEEIVKHYKKVWNKYNTQLELLNLN